jgi:putative membrane-bound dehydrogenase-like protein
VHPPSLKKLEPAYRVKRTFQFCNMNRRFFLATIASLLVLLNCPAAEPPLDPNALPHIPPVESTNAFKTFEIKKGFHLQLVADEPLVMDPIAMSFDENGRLFVVEMRDYSEMRDVHPHLGRIRMLEDTNGDGIFDKYTIYADDLPWPTGVFCYGGGIFVGASPDILYFKDTKGSGVADVRKVVFTGFGVGKGERLNVQALPNSFCWGLDNRIHVETAPNGGLLVPAGHPDSKPLDLNGRDLYFDPRTFDMAAETGGGQYGMCFDNYGRRFVCSNARHIQTFMYEARYGERNPFYNMPAALVDIPLDGPAAEVYRISPEEKWRVIRTQWRVAGQVSGPVESGGRASGYFTSACGITIFRGNNWPAEFLGDAFIDEPANNLVHHKKVRSEGVALVAERPPDEQKVEFLASTDVWFRPVEMANAPDGTLYIADMYREIIEHPWSLPDSIKKLLDLNAGNDRGRIYRVVPDGFKQPKLPRLGTASTSELVATLEHPNGWHRDTAARLLYERQDKSAVPLLGSLLEKSKSPPARLHALYVLQGLASLNEARILTALNDADAHVREHGIRLSETFFRDGIPPDPILAKLTEMANDPAITVRYQLAFTLGEIKANARIPVLAAIAKKDLDSSWTQAAVLSSLAEGAGDLFAALSADVAVCGSKAGENFLRQLVMLVGAKNKSNEIDRILDFIAQVKQPALSLALVHGLGDGLRRAGVSVAGIGRLKAILESATHQATNPQADEATRVEAIELLSLTSFSDSGQLLFSLLSLSQPQPIQLAALDALGRFNDPKIGPELTAHWSTLTPRVRAETLRVLMARADRASALLQAIESGSIQASALDSTQIKFLRNHRDKVVRQLAQNVLSAKPASTRQQVIDAFMPALSLKGDPTHGHKIYQERCISCHRLGGEGSALGPDLVTVRNTGKEKILVNVIDPNREVRPEFVSFAVETKDDDTFIGLIVNETATTITLRQAYGKEDVLNRTNIKRMQSQGQSLMPEGLEAGLQPQDFADLIEYIETAEPASK